MRNKVVLIGLMTSLACLSLKAQLYESYFHVNWNIYQPLSNKEFIDKSSASGISLGFSKFITNRITLGIDGANSTFKQYVPTKTYSIPGGNITTDIYNYQYYLSIVLKGQYFLQSEGRLLPFVGLGAGIAFNEYAQYYNVYSDSENKTGFLTRPEVGLIYRHKEYSRWGLKASLVGDLALIKSPSVEFDNFSNWFSNRYCFVK